MKNPVCRQVRLLTHTQKTKFNVLLIYSGGFLFSIRQHPGILKLFFLIKQFDKRLFILLGFAFIIATVIGTLSHELGHYIAAKSMGYKATVHYSYVNWDDAESPGLIDSITLARPKQPEKGASFPNKEKQKQLLHKYLHDSLWIRIAGPFQTMLTGTIGLLLLFSWRKSFNAKQKLSPGQWLLVFITLFWLRQIAYMAVWFGSFLLTGRLSYSGDEIGIAQELDLPFWLLATATGMMGIIILYIVIFKFIPKTQRFTFILSGMVGGTAGYILWLYLLGPVLMP